MLGRMGNEIEVLEKFAGLIIHYEIDFFLWAVRRIFFSQY